MRLSEKYKVLLLEAGGNPRFVYVNTIYYCINKSEFGDCNIGY